MPQDYIVLNCRCGHVGVIAVANLIEVHGGYVDVNDVERPVRAVGERRKAYPALRSFMWATVK